MIDFITSLIGYMLFALIFVIIAWLWDGAKEVWNKLFG